MHRRLITLSLATLATSFACGPEPLPRLPEPPAPSVEEVSLAAVGLDAEAMDRSVDPCSDFYRYACGGWVEATEIPADQPRWMRSFNVIADRNLEALRTILEEASAEPEGPVEEKLGNFYAACMDEAAIEKAGLSALANLRADIRRVATKPAEPAAAQPAPKPASKPGGTHAKADEEKSRSDAWQDAATPGGEPLALEAVLATLHRHQIWAFFDVYSTQDSKDATRMIAELDQNGLGLPDRDDYLRDDAESQQLRDFYREHVARMLHLAGYGKEAAAEAAAGILELETEIAKISKTRVERRDPDALYNKIDRAGLRALEGPFEWDRYLAALGAGMGEVVDINVTSVPYFENIGTIAEGMSKETLIAYLEWQLLHHLAASLPKAFVDEGFALKKQVTGQQEQRPRWKRCVDATDAYLGELLARPFVKEHFGKESKQAVEEMVGAISKAFRARVGALPWMDAPTKQRALEKLDAMAYLIGFPERWKQYDFEVSEDNHPANVLRGRGHETERELTKIGKPVDRGEWYMTPPTVNAYYSAQKNQMVFPAGILQPPFFQKDANIPVNMGGMGMVVGHELTHAFDDKGSKFDAAGNLDSWWTPQVRERFDDRTVCVVKQYDSYEVLPGVTLDGEMTLGENIADIGGVRLAYAAYRSLRRDAASIEVADGLDEDQQFFVSAAQVWCSKYRDEFKRLRAQTDYHAQPDWRVNGSLRNAPEFADAFECAEGTPMNPKQICEVW